MKASKFTDAQKAFILKQGADGHPVAEICRKAGISEARFFNWKKKYEGLLPDEMRRLKLLEDDSIREVEGLLLSAHRTGGMLNALYEIGRQAMADTELILKGVPPVVCRRAMPETVGRFRSKPVWIT